MFKHATVPFHRVSHGLKGESTAINRALRLNDYDLVKRARDGDQIAFRALYDKNVDRVFRLCFRMVGDEGLAREYTQDAFVRVWERLHQFRGDSAFSMWLHSIAVSVVLNGIRKSDRHRKRERSLEDVGFLAAMLAQRSQGAMIALTAAGWLLAMVVSIAYILVPWARSGATLGKKILSLKIVREDGVEPLGYGKAALRLVGYMVSGMILYIGFIMAAFTENNKALHDMIAGTRVVRIPK